MTEQLSAYIPEDRRYALATGQPLPDRTHGAALFTDVSGFTLLTEILAAKHGTRRGGEELTHYLNHVYDASIAIVEQFGGSVISFSGDAMLCWFDQDDGHRALASAFKIQSVMKEVATMADFAQKAIALAIKVAVAVGPVRRFCVGDPAIHYMDVIAGATLDRLIASEQQAHRGEIVVDEPTAKRLRESIQIREWRTDGRDRFAVVGNLYYPILPRSHSSRPLPTLDEDQIRCWLLPAVYERIKQGQGEFVAELRLAIPIFIKFGGIDYDTDTNAKAKLDAFVGWVQRIFAQYGGTLLQLIIGDKGNYFYGAFGIPTTHHDDALRAVAVADKLRHPPAELAYVTSIQIGISRGYMYTGPYGGKKRRMYGLIGDEANIAARLMQHATPGQIIISSSVADVVHHRYHLDPLGEIYIKGRVDLIDAFGLVGLKPEIDPEESIKSPKRHQPLIVGRHPERAQLQDCLEHLIQDRQGSTVIIQGDAGIGKSCLVEDFLNSVQTIGATYVFGAGDAIDQATLYHSWKSIFSQILDLYSLPEDASVRREHVYDWLHRIDPALAERAPLYAAVAPFEIPDNDITSQLTGQVRAETTREFLAQIIDYHAQSTPLVIVLEDVFWLDSASWALVQRVAALKAPLILVMVTRPWQNNAPKEYQQIVSCPTTTVVNLSPLEAIDAMALVKQRLGVTTLPPSVMDLIQTKAEGNPFFSEELAYALRDKQLILIQEGVCTLAPNTPDLQQIAFPSRVEEVIVSRIDLLVPTHQLVLKVASVVGRIFSYYTLRAIHPVSEDVPYLMDYLDVLAKVDLTPLESPEPDLAYIFKHVITQEVAYNLLLFEQRRKLHQAVVEWFEQTYAEDIAKYYPTLAFHCYKVAEGSTAGKGAIAKAIDYLFKAAEQAVENYANIEASQHLTQALALLQRLPASIERDQQELGMQIMLAYTLVTQRGYGDPDIERIYQRAHQLCETTQVTTTPDSARFGFVLYGIFSFHSARAEYEPGQHMANQLVELGERSNNLPILAVGYQSQGILAFCQGNLPQALIYTQRSYEIAEPLDSKAFFQFGGDFQVFTSTWIVLAKFLLGYPDQAEQIYKRTLAMTEHQPYAHCFVLGFGYIAQLKRDIPNILHRAETLVTLGQKYSFVLMELLGNLFRAWVLATDQNDPAGVQMLENMTPVPKLIKLDAFVPWYLALLAQAYHAQGNPVAAMQTVDEALGYAERAGGNFYQAELLRMKGDILQTQGAAVVQVEQCYREAIVRSQQQQAKWWELRASTSLARLLRSQGQTATARLLLTPIVGWFTEGFTLMDLQEAQTLLAEL